ncbi:disks large-associated protein 5 isoform X2 [Halyomorpha halys]|nr:disks large-associated protein 5-like isoform X2 [Halyomorpha halys]
MEEQKKSQKPPFYSLVRARHTGGTPFRTKQAAKNLAVSLPLATRSRTAFQKGFVFKATLNGVDQNGPKQKDALPIKPVAPKPAAIKPVAVKSQRNNKENQKPTKSNIPASTVANVQKKKNESKPKPVTVSQPAIVVPQVKNGRGLRSKNVAASIVDNVQKKKNEMKPKSALVSKTAIVVPQPKKGFRSKNPPKSKSSEQLCSPVDDALSKKVNLVKDEKSNSKVYKIQEEVNNLLADKLAERVFIMSPLITSNIVTRSTRRRPRPSTGNLVPSELKPEKIEVEEEKSENKEIQSKSVDDSGTIGPEALRAKLEEETSRLNKVADSWSKQHAQDSDSIPEDVKDEILAVVGQTRLLLSDKFQQFRSLIDNALSEHKESAVIKADDLLGFWEMMYLEVEQLNKKYENLSNLAHNGWLPLEKLKTIKKTRKKVNEKKPAASASSKFKEFLKKKKGEETNDEEFNNTVLQVAGTPSLMRTLNSERRTRRSSACNITLQKSFLAKAVLSPLVKS